MTDNQGDRDPTNKRSVLSPWLCLDQHGTAMTFRATGNPETQDAGLGPPRLQRASLKIPPCSRDLDASTGTTCCLPDLPAPPRCAHTCFLLTKWPFQGPGSSGMMGPAPPRHPPSKADAVQGAGHWRGQFLHYFLWRVLTFPVRCQRAS